MATDTMTRADFRLHAMDLNRPAAPVGGGKPHWILQNRSLRSMIATLEKDYAKLCAVGGDPFDGADVTADALLAKIGYACSEEPRSCLASVKFHAGFVAACIRETAWAQLQTGRLYRQAPRRAKDCRS